jgi:biotin carboxyl carrier protein
MLSTSRPPTPPIPTTVSFAGPGSLAPRQTQPTAVRAPENRELQQKLLRAVTANPDKESALFAVGLVIEEALSPAWLVHFDRADGGGLTHRQVPPCHDLPVPRQVTPAAVLDACNAACEQGRQHMVRIGDAQEMCIVAERVFLKGSPPEAVALIVSGGSHSPESLSYIAQLVASHLTLWHILQSSAQLETESRAFSAVLELAGKLACSHDLRGACHMAAGMVQMHLGCQRVAIGLANSGTTHCRLQAISGASKFDRHSELVRAIEAALDESLLRNSVGIWPAASEDELGSTRALQRLCALSETTAAVSAPLCDESGAANGAWVILGAQEKLPRSETMYFLRACQVPLGSCLALWKRAEPGPLSRLVRNLVAQRKSWRGKAALVGGLLLAACLAIPLPYRISASCKLQPVMRRYVAAPFDGVLEQALVAPGDLVSAGDVLARLDGREIRWELAGVTADHNRAAKQADASRAVNNVAAAQQARLEMDRLALKIRLLNDRAEHLEVKSPLTGIVVAGDLEKAEGAPLSVGQTLFEVAPLDKMLVELAVPEEDIAYVASGAEVRVQLDACGSERWNAKIARVHPRSEVQDERNVFIAELTLDNAGGRLHPGLKGTATIVGPRRPLAWNLFHKAWDRLAVFLGV